MIDLRLSEPVGAPAGVAAGAGAAKGGFFARRRSKMLGFAAGAGAAVKVGATSAAGAAPLQLASLALPGLLQL